MKPICFIPARGGSKGISKKNARILVDKPLIAHTIESMLQSGIFENVIVSTEDKEIADISRQYGAEVPFTRSKKLANDIATTDEVLIHGIRKLYSLGFKFEIFVMRDCTVPFIDKNDVNGAIELLRKSDCDAVFGVCRAHPSPYFGMMEVNKEGYLFPSKTSTKLITRRQSAPIVYYTHGLYVHYAKKLLEDGKMLTSKTLPYEIPLEHGFMIDFEIQFKIAEYLYNLKKQSLV